MKKLRDWCLLDDHLSSIPDTQARIGRLTLRCFMMSVKKILKPQFFFTFLTFILRDGLILLYICALEIRFDDDDDLSKIHQ